MSSWEDAKSEAADRDEAIVRGNWIQLGEGDDAGWFTAADVSAVTEFVPLTKHEQTLRDKGYVTLIANRGRTIVTTDADRAEIVRRVIEVQVQIARAQAKAAF